MSAAPVPSYRPFAVTGLELEYAIVDTHLRPQCLVDATFRCIHGRPTSHLTYKQVGFSNELAAHVFEIKTERPQTDLTHTEAILVNGLQFFTQVLRQQFGACLLPTGMHPFMRPTATTLWPRAGRMIYQAYAKIFSLWGHGWLNVQSCQVNLPFGTEDETVALHNAIACLLPYLPALSASSPIYEGTVGPNVNSRLSFYRLNQARVPLITGAVIPEFMTSYRQYRRDILGAIYCALDAIPGAGRLKHEWVNSRGAILRFDRRAIEIRVLDTQECIKMDIAIAVFIRGVLKRLVRELQHGTFVLPEHRMLVQDLNAVVAQGSRACVRASHLRTPSVHSSQLTTARALLLQLLESVEQETPAKERPYLSLVEQRLRAGSLSEQIVRAVRRRRPRTRVQHVAAIRSVYEELIECLEHNTPWEG